MAQEFSYDVVIVGGVGHVGLPLGIAFAGKGMKVCLYDLDQKKAELVKKGYGEEAMPDVETVQDFVEKVLIEEGHAKTAKAYILYRNERSKAREEKEKMLKEAKAMQLQERVMQENTDPMELMFAHKSKMAKIISPRIIDRINIARAANLGAWRVYKKLASGVRAPEALLDGSLFLPRAVKQRTIIKGDEKIPVISAASIIAKVLRDREMLRMHKKYPQYKFDVHKGYGTKLHRKLIRKWGYSSLHRKSFRIHH